MTDKEKLEKIKKLADAMCYAAFNMTTDASLLRKAMDDYHQFIINEYHKEEPVSEVWYNAKKTLPESSTKQIICIKEDGLSVATVGKIVTGTIKWAYLDTLLHISNKNLTESQCRKLIDTAFELGKAANKDKPVSEELKTFAKKESEVFAEREYEIGYIDRNALGKGYYWGCIDGAKWQRTQMMKDAIIATIESDLDSHGADYGNQKIICGWGELETKKFKNGSKVKLIIIKED